MSEVAYGLPNELERSSFATNEPFAGLATEAFVIGADHLRVRRRWECGISGSSSEVFRKGHSGTLVDVAAETSGDLPLETWRKFTEQVYRCRVDKEPSVGVSWPEARTIAGALYLRLLGLAQPAEFLRPIIDRINWLAEVARDEEDQKGLRGESLVGLLRFLYLHKERIEDAPRLVLTMDGHLRGEWRRSPDHRVAVRFIDEHAVSFVTFLPDRHAPTQINHIGGGSSIRGFFENAGIESLPRLRQGAKGHGQDQQRI